MLGANEFRKTTLLNIIVRYVVDALFSSMCSAVIAIAFAVGILSTGLYWQWSFEFLLMPLLFVLAILHIVSEGILLFLVSKGERSFRFCKCYCISTDIHNRYMATQIDVTKTSTSVLIPLPINKY